MKRLLPLLAAVTLVASCVTSETSSVASPSAFGSINVYLAELNDDNFSGVVLVAKDFVPFATKATGYADRARGAPNLLSKSRESLIHADRLAEPQLIVRLLHPSHELW